MITNLLYITTLMSCASLTANPQDTELYILYCRDQQVKLDQWEIEVTLDLQAHLVSMAYLDLLGKKEQR